MALVDPECGWIVCEIRNLMRDPGDGSTFEASNITILRYAGDNRWASEEDVYNPARFSDLTRSWGRRVAELGTLMPDERAWFARAMPDVLPG